MDIFASNSNHKLKSPKEKHNILDNIFQHFLSYHKGESFNANQIFFSDLNSNCTNLLNMINLQKQVKKAFCYQKLF